MKNNAKNNSPLSMAGSSGQGTVATFLGGGAKGHRVDLVMIMSVTWMVIKMNLMGVFSW